MALPYMKILLSRPSFFVRGLYRYSLSVFIYLSIFFSWWLFSSIGGLIYFLLGTITQFFIYCINIIRQDSSYPLLGMGGP